MEKLTFKGPRVLTFVAQVCKSRNSLFPSPPYLLVLRAILVEGKWCEVKTEKWFERVRACVCVRAFVRERVCV